MQIRVEAYFGFKANERPIKFWIGDRMFFVEAVEEQWRGIDATYFRVRADDGNTYVLSYIDAEDAWKLENSNSRRKSAHIFDV